MYAVNTKALKTSLLSLPFRLLPPLSWLPLYSWKADLIRDFMAGLIIAIMQVPHSLGNASLAGVPAILGLYSCVFPAFLYFFLAPSPHLTLGTSALISMVIVGPVNRLTNGSSTSTTHEGDDGEYDETEVATTLAFLVGVIQLALYFCQVKKLLWLMSEVLMNAYILGAVVQATVVQLKTLLGVEAPSHSGVFRLVYAVEDLITEIDTFTWLTFVIGSTSCVVLVCYDIFVKPRLAKYTKLPFPIQLMLVIIFTTCSYLLDFEDEFGVEVLGDIPQGMPTPAVPNMGLIPEVLVEGFIIALISMSVAVSIGKVLSEREGVDFDANQELFAEGSAVVFGSFFLSLPANNTIARTLVQINAGGQSQLTALISALLLVLVLLFLGPLFEPLPKAVLSAIILTALRTMWLNVLDFFRYSRRSLLDGFVWAATFLCTCLLNVDIGLVVGIGLNLLLGFYRGFRYCLVELGVSASKDDSDVSSSSFSSSLKLEEIPWDDSDKILIRKRRRSSLPPGERLDGVSMMRLSGYFTFVNYEKVLGKMKKLLRAGGAAEEEESAAVVDLSHLSHLDQTAARKFVSLLTLDTDKSRRVVVGPNDQVSKMLFSFDAKSTNVFDSVGEAAAVVTATTAGSPTTTDSKSEGEMSTTTTMEEEEGGQEDDKTLHL